MKKTFYCIFIVASIFASSVYATDSTTIIQSNTNNKSLNITPKKTSSKKLRSRVVTKLNSSALATPELQPMPITINPNMVNSSTDPMSVNTTPPPTNHKTPYPLSAYIEAGMDHFNLTNGFQNWNGQYLKGSISTSSKNTWFAEMYHQQEFGEQGNYLGLSNTHTFNDNWYSIVNVATSNAGFFYPRLLLGATLYRKVDPRKSLVLYFGGHQYWWRNGYSSEDINPGFIYYFDIPLILEAGSYINRSNPGVRNSAAGYVAITQGRDKEHYLTIRYGFGKEAYLANGDIAVGYPSQVVTATWRQWINHSWGLNLVGEAYHNPLYNRYGFTAGVFKDF